MRITKILARKDAYSVVLAIILGLMIQSVLYAISFQWANKVSVSSEGESLSFTGSTGNWRNDYLVPIMTFLISFVIIEVLLQIVNYFTKQPDVVKKKK